MLGRLHQPDDGGRLLGILAGALPLLHRRPVDFLELGRLLRLDLLGARDKAGGQLLAEPIEAAGDDGLIDVQVIGDALLAPALQPQLPHLLVTDDPLFLPLRSRHLCGSLMGLIS